MSLITNIDEIRAVPIEDVVGRYLTLRRAGTRLVACCPFHTERSASFGVSPTRGIYKCFGCGEGGDSVDFVMKHENLTFLEAVERIAADHGIRLEKDHNVDWDAEKARLHQERQEKESLHLVQEWAAQAYFTHNFGAASPLPSGEGSGVGSWGTVSLDGRPLSWSTVRDFELCYTSDDSNFLRVESVKAGWGNDILLRTGLLREGRDNSGTYDGFYRRHLFPVRDHHGKMAGFGARILREDAAKPDNRRPKYINSPEHLLYNKSQLLYGLWQNKKRISAQRADYSKNEGFAYIVEGYMDVVTMYDYGIQNAVAPCGTALTDEQIALLAKYTDEVVLCFDSDKAGDAATARSIERLLQKGFKVSILNLTTPGPEAKAEKHDPDSFLRRFGLTWPVLSKVRMDVEYLRYYIEEQPAATEKKTGKKAPAPARHYFFEGSLCPWKCPAEDLRYEQAVKTYHLSLQSGDAGWAGRMHNLVGAVEWMVMRDYKPDDPHSKAEKIELAARLLGYLDSENLRNRYLEDLCTKAKLGNVKRDLKDAIAERRDEVLRRGRTKLTHEQTQDRLRYGIYISGQKYWQAVGDGEGYELTNFYIQPLMCVIGQQKSLRLVRITNEDGFVATIEMDSDDIVELSTFKKVVARKGNYVFKATCKAEHFARIQAKVMAETPNVYPIYTMGMHERPDGSTFYAFANGIFTAEGFHPVDDYGSVRINDITYYLPAFSKIRIDSLGEQTTESFDDIRYYYYPTAGDQVDFHEWTARMQSVYGKNGIVAACWALAAIHRDIIFKRFMMFPHLNLFGVPQSGKNQLAGSITALFGLPQAPIGLENATRPAMARLISIIRNGVVWFDEYKNDVDRWIVEMLKGFADGTGRRTGDAKFEKRTLSTPVNSAAIISGQHQLTLDIAMFSRTISLNFDKTTFTDEQRNNIRDLKNIEETGILTRIATQVHGHRDVFQEKFGTEFEFTRRDFSDALPGDTVISDRVLNMFCIPLTAYRLLRDRMKFAFTYEDIRSALVGLIMVQKESMFAENEVSIWWRIIEFLIERGELKHGHDIIVEYAPDETFDEDWSGKRQKKVQYADHTGSGQVKLAYLYLGVSHPLYMKCHYDERKVKGLDKQALTLYLRTSEAFAGLKRAKKFMGKPKSCMVFECEKLPFDLPLTIEVLAKQSRKEPEEPQAAAPAPAAEEDLPF